MITPCLRSEIPSLGRFHVSWKQPPRGIGGFPIELHMRPNRLTFGSFAAKQKRGAKYGGSLQNW